MNVNIGNLIIVSFYTHLNMY